MSEEEIDRKIAVIFATDVVGYSKHMEADESGTIKNLRACEKILTGLFEKHARKYRQYDSIQSAEINKGLAIWCPDARQDRKQINNEQQRGYQLPHIDLAKENFEEAIGGKVDW